MKENCMSAPGTPPHRETGLEPLAVRIPEACRLTGIGRSKLYELIAEGQLEIVKVGAMTLVPMKSLRALIEQV